MYGQPAKESVESIPVGIQENVLLDHIAYEPAKKEGDSAKVFAFYFKDEAGRLFRHLEWEVDRERAKATAQSYGKDPLTYADEQETRVSERVYHILSNFVPMAKLTQVTGSSFGTWCEAVVKALGEANKGVKLRLKLVYNNADYVSLPRVTWNGGFCQKMDFASTLRLTQYDRVEKKQQDDLSGLTANVTADATNGKVTPAKELEWDN